MADVKREALPQDIEPYKQEAASCSKEDFQRNRPYPFLLYARSKLWDPTLLLARGSGGDETRMVSYEFHEGGMAFVHPIRKRQTDPNNPGIILGRATHVDCVVPVASISSQHIIFQPPGASPVWTVIDQGSRNGTWLNEEKLAQGVVKPIKDAEYLRLGGNLIAWFLYPGHFWTALRNPDELNKLIEL